MPILGNPHYHFSRRVADPLITVRRLCKCHQSTSKLKLRRMTSLHWCHNERDGVPNHRRLDCLINRLFRRRSNEISKLCVAGLCEGNPPVISGFSSQMDSNEGNVSIWWRHHSTIGHTPLFSLISENYNGNENNVTLFLFNIEENVTSTPFSFFHETLMISNACEKLVTVLQDKEVGEPRLQGTNRYFSKK